MSDQQQRNPNVTYDGASRPSDDVFETNRKLRFALDAREVEIARLNKELQGSWEPQPDSATGWPESKTDAIDALRSAVVAQTALLRSISEQVRLGFEDLNYVELSARLAGLDEKLAALAERLEKLEAHFTSGPSWTHGFTTAAKQYNEELTGHLQAIEAKLGEIDSRTVNQWTAIELAQRSPAQSKQNQSLTSKEKPARKAKR